MRKYFAALLIVAALTPACARLGAGQSSTGSGSGISIADAITQADGALTALETLIKSAPLDAQTQAQIDGYAAWAKMALQAAGIIVPVAKAVAAGS